MGPRPVAVSLPFRISDLRFGTFAVIKYHGNGNPDSALVKLEMEEMDQAFAESTGSDKRWWDYRGLFMTANSRYRMLSVLLISVFGQFSGNGLGYFQNVIYENLGYTDVQTQLALNLGGWVLASIFVLAFTP